MASSRRPQDLKTLDLHEHDLPDSVYRDLSIERVLGTDTETSGLDYRKDKLALVQLATVDGCVHMVRRPDHKSFNLQELLLTSRTQKIFHHALFDLRFIKVGMNIESSYHGVHCTKTLMKITCPELKAGLAASLREILDIRISKAETMTDWFADKLTDEQLWYGAGDVLYLPRLLKAIQNKANIAKKIRYDTVIQAIVIKANLEVEGYTDLFDYPQEESEVTIENRNWWLRHQLEQKEN